MFQGLGVLLALYVAYAISEGRVYVKSGFGGRAVYREETPRTFWAMIGIYAGLSLALFFVF